MVRPGYSPLRFSPGAAMKNAAICAVICGLAFGFMGLQVGLFDPPGGAEESAQTQESRKPEGRKLKFPRDLGPAARAQPVPEATAFNADAKKYPLVFLKMNGALYEKWQERLNDGWAAETVEQTQLAVVVSEHKKHFIGIYHYPNGAPPIERFRWELEASVVEVKTGKVLANRTFVNMPRAIKPVEAWELTRLGEPVQFKTVYNWVVSHAKANFPEVSNPAPLVNVIE